MASPNSSCLNLNCVSLRKAMLLRQVKRFPAFFDGPHSRVGTVWKEGISLDERIHSLQQFKERSNFDTKPCAPANFDSARVSLSLRVEIKSIGMLGNTLLISRVVLKPSRNGMMTSEMIKSGFSRSVFSIRSSPFDASRQTFRSGRDCSWERRAARIPGWLSAISIWQQCRNPL